MSAYIVAPKTINRIISLFEYALTPDTHYDMEEVLNRSCLHNEGYFDYIRNPSAFSATIARVKLAKRLYLMNEESVKCRYNEERKAVYEEEHAKNIQKSKGSLPELVQWHKSIACYLYQCTEGDIPETVLFKDMESLNAVLIQHIVCSLPEYDKAEWG